MLEVDSYSRTEAAFSMLSYKNKGHDSVYIVCYVCEDYTCKHVSLGSTLQKFPHNINGFYYVHNISGNRIRSSKYLLDWKLRDTINEACMFSGDISRITHK